MSDLPHAKAPAPHPIKGRLDEVLRLAMASLTEAIEADKQKWKDRVVTNHAKLEPRHGTQGREQE